ncbi:decapping and exoribonuclease protein [Hyalella azteca]|uniref:Decapping nuclease n=1 Tax=Hyalella azteca TaxID=294128 RepID=A0A8B7N0G5_HYAAZ|nr:decapping and exoribonuclease protein [Hyalella azteca]
MASYSSSHGYSRSAQLSPTIIGHFSLDCNRQFHDDGRNLARIAIDWDEACEKAVYLDLNLAMEDVRRMNMEDFFNENGKLTHVQQWIMRHPQSMCPKPDFVTSRYVARHLLTSIYSSETLKLRATRVGETIFMCQVISDDQLRQLNASEDQLRMASRGLKFEQFMTDGSDPSTGNDENESYCVIVRTQLSEHSLLYGAEVDGMDKKLYSSNRLPRPTDLIELKTHRLSRARTQSLPKYKMRETWVQCALVGIPRVVCGFRDDRGVVRRLRSFRVANLPSDSQGFFSPDAMVTALNELLQWAKTEVEDDDPQAVYELSVTGRVFHSRRLSPAEADTARFLSPDFVKAMLSN